MGITKTQIFEVADQLDAAGLDATMTSVRKTLGRGSFTTISQALTEWKSHRTALAVAEIWSAAFELANMQVASERKSLVAALRQLEVANAEVADLSQQLSAQLCVLKSVTSSAQRANEAPSIDAGALRHTLSDHHLKSSFRQARAN